MAPYALRPDDATAYHAITRSVPSTATAIRKSAGEHMRAESDPSVELVSELLRSDMLHP